MDNQDAGAGLSPVMKRTALFVLGGVGVLLLGSAVQPRFRPTKIEADTQRVLFPDLTDAGKAASLEIVSYDDELATLHPFKVVQSGGVWVLPSHQNYPADARDHLAAAATELVDLESLDVVSRSPADHETYGVIEPDPEKLKPGMTGIGQLVEIRDPAGTKIARLVVGKEDRRPAGGDMSGRALRFVRKAGQDPVYRVEIDTSKFTTRFGDWIEKDLLKLSPWDVRRLVIDDYSLAAVESGGRIRVEQDRRNRIELAYDDKDSKWNLAKLEAFAQGKDATEQKLAEGEELASGKLNDLRNALGDLKIIDVVRKPSGLSAELKAEEKFVNDPEAVASMQQRGFLPLKSGDILSTNGDTIVGMKDGVEYVLRFGAGTTVAGEDAKAGEKEGAAEGDAGQTSGRYLLVMARFNEDLLEKPKLDPVPDAPAADADQGKDQGKDKDKDKDKEDDKQKGDSADKADKEGAAADGTASESLKKAEEADAKAAAALEERRRVERENRRRQDEYDEKVKAAQKRVRELNNRFADWYYVVPDKEYAKIHLDRAGVVQKKEKQEAAAPAPQ